MAKSGRSRKCSEERGVIGRSRQSGEFQNRNSNARSLPGFDFANSVRSYSGRICPDLALFLALRRQRHEGPLRKMAALAQGPPALGVNERLGGFGISCGDGDDRLNGFGVELSHLLEECSEAVMQTLEMDGGPQGRPKLMGIILPKLLEFWPWLLSHSTA